MSLPIVWKKSKAANRQTKIPNTVPLNLAISKIPLRYTYSKAEGRRLTTFSHYIRRITHELYTRIWRFVFVVTYQPFGGKTAKYDEWMPNKVKLWSCDQEPTNQNTSNKWRLCPVCPEWPRLFSGDRRCVKRESQSKQILLRFAHARMQANYIRVLL